MATRYLSLFSGMEAAHLAWTPLRWQCVAVAEVDPAACAVIRHPLPDVPDLGDVTKITDNMIQALGHIDVVIGGSPCQDLSIAGKRAGLAGARSGLFHHQLRIFDAARHLCGARWLILENVPGAFSSNKGGDFAVVVSAMAGRRIDVPADGWGSEGVALGKNGLVEWSVLDAQWFGLAQRQKRVFAVLDTGDWASRPPILLERDSVRGDSPPSREAWEDVAGTLTRSAGERGAADADRGQLICMAHGQGGAEITLGERSPTLTCNHEAPILVLVQEVAHTLRADGFDASEDGTGRGTPLVPCYAIQAGALRTNPDSGPDGIGVQSDVAYTLEARAEVQCIAFDCKASGQSGFGIGDIASTMRSMGRADSHQNGGGHLAVNQGMQVRRLTPIECERLQGAPDNWTLVPNAAGKPMADGPRYKMLGNSFAVPVIRWIGERIDTVAGGAA